MIAPRLRRWAASVAQFGPWLICIAALVYTVVGTGYQLTVIGNAFLVGLAAVGASFLLRSLRLVTLSQGAMIGLGAYVELILGYDHNFGFIAGLLIAVAAGLVTGVLMGLAASRLRSHYFILLTAAVQTTGIACAVAFTNLTGGAEGEAVSGTMRLLGFTLSTTKSIAILIGAVSVALTVVAEVAFRGALGSRLQAVAIATPAARASGNRPLRANIIGNCVAAVLGAIAGALYAPFIGYVGPDDFSIALSVLVVLAGAVGIRTSFALTVVAALALEEFTQDFSSLGHLTGVLYGAVVIAVGIVWQRSRSVS